MDLTRLSTLVSLFCTTFPALKPLYRDFKKNILNAHRMKIQLQFLKNCRDEKVIPKSFLPKRLRNLDGSPFSELERLLLDSHIKNKSTDMKSAFQKSTTSRSLLKNSVTQEWFSVLCDFIYGLLREKCRAIKEKLNNKLETLFERSFWSQKSNPDLFVNLSSYVLDKNEKLVLGFGYNFSVAKSNVDPISIAKSFIKLEKNASNGLTCEEILIAKGCVYAHMNKPCVTNIPRRFEKALVNLKSNKNIHITKADKSNSFVILDKSSYEEKLNDLLCDESTYSKIPSDPTIKVNKNFNSKIKYLLKDNPNLLKSFLVINPSLSYMYGLVKTHKANNPLRPIISSVGSISYKLSKWLANKLSPLVGTISNSHIKNSSDLVDKLKSHHGNYKLISFDVNSLFTKVPVHDLLEFLKEEICKLDIPFSNNCFMELLKLCVLDNHFVVNDKYFKQTFGFAMGNCLSPILANLYMEFFETRILPQICDFPLIWYRYVDDIIVLWPMDKDPMNFLEKLNKLIESISFKIEIENNYSLPFLDTLIIRTNGQLKFDIYRKPTAVDSYIHYFSNHHVSVKKSVFVGMFLRAFRICDPEYFDTEIKRIFDIGRKLCYPLTFLESCFNKTKRRFYEGSQRDSIVLVNILSLPFRHEFCPLVNLLKVFNINVIFKYEDTIRNIVIKNSPESNTNIGVYNVPCKDCNLIYVGQSGKLLSERLKQHKYNIRTANESSALFKHQQNQCHLMNWNNSKVVFKCNDTIVRLIVEGAIIKLTNNMNLCNGLFKIDNILLSIFKNNCRIKRAVNLCQNNT